MNIQNQPLIYASWLGLIRASIGLSIVALVICGFVYSTIGTLLGQLLFPEQANGSLIVQKHRVIGSSLVAQPFVQNQYFHPRPSASYYNPMAMAGSNLALTNPELHKIVQERINQVSRREHIDSKKIPVDLVTASGSGIDPDISVESAKIQVKRIARARHLPEQEIMQLIDQSTKHPTFGALGQARVNVLELNLALDQKIN